MNLKLRLPEPEDAATITALANNRKIFLNLRDGFPHPYHLKDAEGFIERARSGNPPSVFAIEWEGQYVGGMGLHLQEDVARRTAEIGYWIGEPFWGKGIATEAVRQIVKYGFEELDLARIYAGIFEWNPGSMRVLEKCGFTLERIASAAVIKDGQIIDSHDYAIINPKYQKA